MENLKIPLDLMVAPNSADIEVSQQFQSSFENCF